MSDFRRLEPGAPLPERFLFARQVTEAICKAILLKNRVPAPSKTGAMELWKEARKTPDFPEESSQALLMWTIITWGNYYAHDQAVRLDPPPEFVGALTFATETLISWYREIDGCETLEPVTDRCAGPWLTLFDGEHLLIEATGSVLVARPFGRAGKDRKVDLGSRVISLAAERAGARFWALTDGHIVRVSTTSLQVVGRRIPLPVAVDILLAAQNAGSRAEILAATSEGAVRIGVGPTGRARTSRPGPISTSAAGVPDGGFVEIRAGGTLAGPLSELAGLHAAPARAYSCVDAAGDGSGSVLAAGTAASQHDPEVRVLRRTVAATETVRLGVPGPPARVSVSRVVATRRQGPLPRHVVVQIGDELLSYDLGGLAETI